MGNLGTTPAFYTARPAVQVDGQDAPDLSDGLLTLLVEETTAGLYRCEATFGNWGTGNGDVDFLYFDRRLLDFGKPFGVTAGAGEGAREIFNGRIMALEAHYPQTRPPEIVVLAEDRFQDLRMTRRTRTFEDLSDQEVIEQIAAEYSLRTELDIDGPTHRVLAQVNQSDLAFLRERARAIDAELWLDDETLNVQARSRRDAGTISLTYGQGLIAFSVLADLAEQRTSLAVSGWDVAAKETIEHEADVSTIQSELNGHQGGAAVLERALGPRAERIVHMAPFTGQEAEYLAQANYRRTCRRFVTGRGVAEGDGRIRVGAHVELDGLGTLFNGEYTVTAARHTFNGQDGFRTTFTVERPGIGTG